ncbi:MAG: hypothetical protein DRH24_20525, partial [Deltaproteobacteria bacterium]
LCATYGNDRAAIKYFKKAIALDPQKSEACFQMGISYGELGEYQKAIASINKAIALDSLKGLYFYGRGRVHLLSGQKDKAMNDFKQADSLGSMDAKNFRIKNIEQKLPLGR